MGAEVEQAATMQLISAVEDDDWDEAEKLLHAGVCDVNARTLDFGHSLLQSAAQHGALEVCRLLLAQRADVNAIDGSGKTPLISCIIGGDHGGVVAMLLDARADASSEEYNGSSAIDCAKHVQRNQVMCVLEKKGVIQRTSSALPVVEPSPTLSTSEVQDPPGTTVPAEPTATKPTGAENAAQLIEAVENEFWDDAAALLRDGGCDVNAVNARTRDFGCSLLQYAAEHEASDVCQLLLAQRADVHAVDWSRVPSHITSVFSGDKRLASMLTGDSTVLKRVKRLRKDEVAFSDVRSAQQSDDKRDGKHVVADNTHMIAAVENGAWDKAAELIQAGGDVNARTRDFGHSLLQEAAQQGALDVCRLLLAQRADVNAADRTKMTPLISCVIGGDHGQVISTLLDARADASMQAHDGYTAAKWAKRLRRKQIMEALKKAGVHERQ